MKKHNRLVSFGDSFVWGSELNDCLDIYIDDIVNNPDKYPNELKLIQDRKIGPYSESTINFSFRSRSQAHSLSTWPAQLAKHLNLKYTCVANPGISNQSIIRQLVKFITEIEPSDLVVIDWTFIDRWDYVDRGPQ